MKLTKNYGIEQLIADLEGTENLSLEAEGYVLIKGGKLYCDGKIIKPTPSILIELWDKEVGSALFDY